MRLHLFVVTRRKAIRMRCTKRIDQLVSPDVGHRIEFITLQTLEMQEGVSHACQDGDAMCEGISAINCLPRGM